MELQPESSRVFVRQLPSVAISVVLDEAESLGLLTDASRFRSPEEIADELDLVLRVADLPGSYTEFTDGHRVIYRWHDDQRERGTRLFRGIASAWLVRQRGEHSQADVWFLAGELAAPPVLVRRVGIAAAVQDQVWATEQFLRTWWAARSLVEFREITGKNAETS